ncbi:hypothetical protein [Paenibacillus sp. GCM10027626]|uniref:hypothetical protein n=1 Tax=Paenibacillus sp. GCM10027626 TaxID=3273411 RepID=UPI003631EE40
MTQTDTKRCLFCNQIVSLRLHGEYEWYENCQCAEGKYYGLKLDSYPLFQALPHHTKGQIFPIISAYIRELTDCGQTVTLSGDDIEAIPNSPRIPVTVEAKGNRFLHYLQRHTKGPGDPLVISKLPTRYNLTYSPTLQEMIYIIETLKDKKWIERAGSKFSLTEQGWLQATATVWGKKLKPCVVLLPETPELREEWFSGVFPRLEQCGYNPQIADTAQGRTDAEAMTQLLDESKLLIADLSAPGPETYYATGYALGLNLPVIWTAKREDAHSMEIHPKQIRHIIWSDTEELAATLQERLSV